MSQRAERYWEEMVGILLQLVDAQLAWGHSVLVDSVFMGVDENHTHHSWSDRQRAYELARRHQVNFRPIYLFVSDENVWRDRLTRRAEESTDERVATWERVAIQRQYFQTWQPGQALFVDCLNSVEDNLTQILTFIKNPALNLTGWE